MKQWLRILPALLWMTGIYITSSQQNLGLEGAFSAYDWIARKIAHVTVYAILLMLVYFGVQGNTKHRMITSALISFLYAITDELHQSFVPTRSGQWTDVVIDSLGITVGLFLIQYIHGKKPAGLGRDESTRE